MTAPIPPKEDDVVQWVTVRQHANGMLSVQGTIADKRMALHLLDHARDALKRSVPEYKAIIIPGSEVEIAPSLPVKEMGMIPAHQRGDS